MNASHEALKLKPMPFILDSTRPTTPPATTSDGDFPTPSSPNTSSTTPHRPHRTQSTTALLHHPLRLPPTVPEDPSLPVQDSLGTFSGSPRRPRATTTLPKPRSSAERVVEEEVSWWTEEIHKRREIRRRWKEVEDENTVVIGNKVDTNHPNYVTAYNMLTGLRVAVPLTGIRLILGIESECKSRSGINR
jgi:hypothetical protein